ncbi:MAG: glycosyl transferase, partial [Cyanobacteria bacterium J06553_1]
HQQNGYLAELGDTEDLARGIEWILADEARHTQLRIDSRARATQNFSLEQQTQKYLRVFADSCSKLAP